MIPLPLSHCAPHLDYVVSVSLNKGRNIGYQMMQFPKFLLVVEIYLQSITLFYIAENI